MTKTIQKLPAAPEGDRVESGVVQFGEDWPGYFMRGDTAAGMAGTICGMVAFGMAGGRLSPMDFFQYGILLAFAQDIAACDQSGFTQQNIETMQVKLAQAAVLLDAPPAGGVQ